MKICVVTVTYGNRAGLCIQISNNALAQGVHQLIIVDNGSVPESRDQLLEYAGKHEPVRLITLESNTGSARGFGAGIEAFLVSGCDFILMMDDDNLLEPGALQNMIRFWEGVNEKGKEENIALSAFRKDRPNMIAALQSGNPRYILPAENSFMGFHIRLAWRFIRQRIKSDPAATGCLKPFLEIKASTYGGLWMHRQLCERVGLPDTDYVLYMDDFAFTKKITGLNGKIILLRDCIIQDLQESYYLPAKKKWLYHSLLYAPKDSITYYTCRNIIFFCNRYGVTNRTMYRVNRIFYFTAVSFLAIISNKIPKLRVIIRAVKDAELPDMGFKPDFPL